MDIQVSCVGAVLILLLTSGPGLAAQTQPRSAVADAQRLRDAGNFSEAVDVLRQQLARQPNDGEAARLMAQTLYWLHDLDAAERAYDDALVRHPEDTTLRLQYGRMLAETKQYVRAEAVLTPLRESEGTRGDASALLGSVAYWRGDLTRAERLFREALLVNPQQPDAWRQLAEILAVSAPWVRVSTGLRHDDQPIDRFAGGLEAGWFATALVPVTFRFEPIAFRLPGTDVRQIWSAEVGVAAFLPAAHLETEVAGGVVRRTSGVDDTDWRGRAAIGVRLAPSVTVRGRAERAPYLHTAASLTTPVMTNSLSGMLQWNARGWLAEAALQNERFPDANNVRTAYAWLMAPLVYQDRTQLQVGYAFSRSDADESRFALAAPNQPFDPSDLRFSTAGRYTPYYTPDNLMTHSITGAAALQPSPSTTVRLNGSYALRATDDVPVFIASAGQVQRLTYPRTFSPWRGSAAADVTLRAGVTLGVAVELGRTAFYRWATGDVYLRYRLASTPRRAAQR